MNCSRCGRPAKHFFSQTVNGKNSVLFLCDDCLVAGGFVKFEHTVKPAKTNNIICPYCSTRLNEFLQSGYLGCPACYAAFGKEIANVLPQMQVGVQHKGKRLTRAQGGAVQERQSADKPPLSEPSALTAEQKIAKLKIEMERASKELRFGDAQQLYREIIELGGKV